MNFGELMVAEAAFFIYILGQLPDSVPRAGESITTLSHLEGDAHMAEEQKSWMVALLLSWLLWWLAADRFYLGYTGLGIAKLLTLGGCGIWATIDFILILMNKLPDAEGRPLAK
jgi:hypothetical protein